MRGLALVRRLFETLIIQCNGSEATLTLVESTPSRTVWSVGLPGFAPFTVGFEGKNGKSKAVFDAPDCVRVLRGELRDGQDGHAA